MGQPLSSQDRDLLAQATARQRAGMHFAGLIYAPQLAITVVQAVRDLGSIAKVCDPADIADRVGFLPLR
ncbi:MAG: hypothetical protein ABSH20_09195 [Tepidisphaeraceae bacterium]